jgi:hypothetical protein
MTFYPDFTGLHAKEEAQRHGHIYSEKELSRMRADQEEGGAWEQPPFQHTIDIVPANDGPTYVGFDIARDGDYGLVYGRTADGAVHVLDELDLQADNDNEPSSIGLSGFAQTGKTTVANYIEAKYGYRRQHIAEPLRDMLRTLLRRFGLEDELITRYLTGDLKEKVIPELGVTSRHAQITIGTEWGRELIDDDLWANLWAYEADQAGGKAMNDSVRFPNEEQAIRALGGFTILVVRPGTRPAAFKSWLGRKFYDWFGCMWGVHPSERIDLLNPDYTIVNSGSLEELYCKVDEIMEREAVLACAR